MTKKKTQTNNETGLTIRRIPKAKSENQSKYMESIAKNTVTFCTGKPGTGKSHLAVGMACAALWQGKVEHIVVTRPVIETGKGLGYLPGTFEEKMSPYLVPIMEEMKQFFDKDEIDKLRKNELIRIIPLEYMRGMNLHNCFVIGDEFQNATLEQIKMFLTRMGKSTKMVVNGDIDQTDLKNYDGRPGLQYCLDRLQDVDGIGMIHLEACDIVRNPIIANILERLTADEV